MQATSRRIKLLCGRRPPGVRDAPRDAASAYAVGIPLETFFLGTHHPGWLSRTDVPLFVSRRRLAAVRRPPRAAGEWALDSGGFTELSMFGRWTVTPRHYAVEVRRYADEVGNLRWAAQMDRMVEPFILRQTG